LLNLFALESWKGGQTIQFGSLKTNPSVAVAGEEPDGMPTNNWTMKEGRSLNDDDVRYSSFVVILAQDVVTKIFPHGGAVGVRFVSVMIDIVLSEHLNQRDQVWGEIMITMLLFP